MQKDTKNIELLYGEAKIIASKAHTKPSYVRNVLYRYRKGHNAYGDKAKRIIRIYKLIKSKS